MVPYEWWKWWLRHSEILDWIDPDWPIRQKSTPTEDLTDTALQRKIDVCAHTWIRRKWLTYVHFLLFSYHSYFWETSFLLIYLCAHTSIFRCTAALLLSSHTPHPPHPHFQNLHMYLLFINETIPNVNSVDINTELINILGIWLYHCPEKLRSCR